MLRKLLVVAVTVIGLGVLALPASASVKVLPLLLCTVVVSNQQPADYSTVNVDVYAGAAGITATVTAHYSTKNTVRTGVTATRVAGSLRLPYLAVVPFKISDARPGYKVVVSTVVSWPGWRPGSCSASFTPKLK